MTETPKTGGVTKLPDVGRIQGFALQKSTTAALSTAAVQYTDRNGQWYELKMPFLDALYLLNLLEAASADSGFDHLRRAPR